MPFERPRSEQAPRKEQPFVITKTFEEEAEARAFILRFWEAVGMDPYDLDRLQKPNAYLREVTLQPNRSVLQPEGEGWKVGFYSNSDTNPMTKQAIDFLRKEGLIEDEGEEDNKGEVA